MNNKSAELYLKFCELPLDKQRRFLEWARVYINKLEREIKHKIAKEKENELSSSKE